MGFVKLLKSGWGSTIAAVLSTTLLCTVGAESAHAWPKLFKKSQGANGSTGEFSGPINGPVSGPVSSPAARPSARPAQSAAPVTTVNNDSTVGPSIGKYFISGATTRLNQFIMIKKGGNYELFSPNGMSLGSGVYSYSNLGGAVLWQSGPLTSPDFNGDQRYEVLNGGRTESIRVQPQAYATSTR